MQIAKFYSLSKRNQKFVDKKFDKLHNQIKMSWIIEATSHKYSIFVIWRTIQLFDKKSKRKKRAIIDIRELNKITKSNNYFMQLQFDITSIVQNCLYITIVNYSEFFYQWRVRVSDRSKLIVISHRDNEHFNIIVMNFRNSSIYVQRKIDQLLREYRVFARIYVNDVIIFNKILKKHVQHLTIIFSLFIKLRINLKFFKTYLSFFFVILFDQYVIVINLTIVTKKLKIILKFRFSTTLKNLKHYLKLIDWFRNYIERYAQKTKSLQRRKTTLLRLFFINKKNQRKIYNQRVAIKKSLVNEIVVYEILQIVFNKSTFLIHFNFDRILFIDVDASKKLKFDIVIYHVKHENNYREFNSKLLIVKKIWNLYYFLTNAWSRRNDDIDLRNWKSLI